MESNIIIEINSVVDDKRNTINIVKWEPYFKCNMKMPIKVNQIHTLSSKMHVLFSIVISRLCRRITKVVGVDNHSKW